MTEAEGIPATDWFGGAKTVLFVHAHPDDESIWTGGAIAALNSAGRDAAVLTLTRGEQGEAMPLIEQDLPTGTARFHALAEVREGELAAALAALGVRHHAFLGQGPARAAGLSDRRYEDSGMQWGEDGVAAAADSVSSEALTRASVAEALADTLAFVDALGAEALVSYDEHGGYGHPDHIFAHRLARSVALAFELPFWEVRADEARLGGGEAYDVRPWRAESSAARSAHASQLVERDGVITLTGGQVHRMPEREFYARVDG